MGIFPILMNVLQFWLIDSIVKASSVAAVALDIEHDAQHDREPLFNSGSDDEEDDHPTRSNVLNRRDSLTSYDSRGLHSHDDLTFDTEVTTLDENKPLGNASKPADAYSYPPSLSSSFSSDAPSTHDPKAPRVAKNLMKKSKRRDGPTPLNAHTQHELSHTAGPSSMPHTPPAPPQPPVTHVAMESLDWADTWDDAVEWDKNGHKRLDSVEGWNGTHQSVRTDS